MIFKSTYFRIGFIILIALLISYFILISSSKKVEAVPGLPFGGVRVGVILCTCDIPITAAITLIDYTKPGPPKLLTLKYYPGFSILYPFGNLLATYYLGDYFLGSTPCLFGVPPFCVPSLFQPTGIVSFMGTSKF